MGIVIHHNFKPQPPRDYIEEHAATDLLFFIEHEDVVEQARLRIEEANAFLFAIRKITPDHAELERQRNALSFYPVQELCALVLDMPRTAWIRRPEYVGALALEYQHRHDCATYFATQYGADDIASLDGVDTITSH
jgi:hypothetical protein